MLRLACLPIAAFTCLSDYTYVNKKTKYYCTWQKSRFLQETVDDYDKAGHVVDWWVRQ